MNARGTPARKGDDNIVLPSSPADVLLITGNNGVTSRRDEKPRAFSERKAPREFSVFEFLVVSRCETVSLYI